MDTMPWYRQPWPWFLIALPATAVIGSITAAVLAVRSGDEVIATDYYRRGLAINDEISKRARAAQLGLALELSADGLHAGDRLVLRVVGRQPLPADATLQLRLVVPGRSETERMVVLARTGSSSGATEANFAGAWLEEPQGHGVVRQWTVEGSSWLVDGDADWHIDDERSRFTARAVAQ
ncbi:MAG TPA: FixH family protein [Burkholderiaceae bacterium]|nr:FixH family protein [Burkholderiaceae bacterium]